jgi:predicted SnoaL-like aldol condensation-catalyzing enzyme
VSPEDIVRSVFERVHASDPAVGDLYAEDAVRIDQYGQHYEGRAAITEFYASIFPTPEPHPELEAMFVNLPFVGALLRLPRHDGNAGLYLDLFEVEDGSIRSLWVMFQPAGA